LSFRGAALLDKPEGQRFIQELWKEIVADVAKIDPALKSYYVESTGS
jgi:hypothetical protein